MKQKTTLITGGAGFLGSHLCDYLLEKGHFVICMDDFVTGNKDNIKHLLNNKRFKFVNHNVTKFIDVEEKVDYIYCCLFLTVFPLLTETILTILAPLLSAATTSLPIFNPLVALALIAFILFPP